MAANPEIPMLFISTQVAVIVVATILLLWALMMIVRRRGERSSSASAVFVLIAVLLPIAGPIAVLFLTKRRLSGVSGPLGRE